MAKANGRRAVVVTTEFRGVFFGYLAEDHTPEKVMLENARNCVYWSQDVKGVFGLAANGPTSGCRIGPAVPAITLVQITSVTDCSPAAIKAWEAATWN